MVVQTYQPASNETLGQFVDLLFQRLFFAHDAMPVVLSTYENDPVNGKHLSAAAFLEVTKGFHATSLAKLTTIEDLVVISKFTITNKADGKVSEHVSVTIVKVEEKEGRRVMSSLVETQA
ncbi:hypothetical protein B0H14DRAFT_2890573 [Mycena olivaceomarginata]|nr:hypothetical protein B0H14DRAFT_2890573 [Mycena olivaceomarginata]